MKISPLNNTTIKLVTSTQVITSVFTVVKELVENALDADAKNIEVNLIDNGLTLIEVRDDGTGISKENTAVMALPSHTSKILDFADLESLRSYGFRGEALNALSQVADVTIITRTKEDDVATIYSIDHDGNVINMEASHHSLGTTVQVRALFKNLHVRRQFAMNSKRSKQDVKLTESLLKCYGICKSSVRFSFKVNNSVVFIKPSFDNVRNALAYTFGSKATPEMEWIEVEATDTKIQLMVPKKTVKDVLNICHVDQQYIFINDRPVKHKEFEKTIIESISEYFGEKMPPKKKPVFFLSLSLPPSELDVNLEPNKTAVLLKNQKDVLEALKERLIKFYELKTSPEVRETPKEIDESSEFWNSVCDDEETAAEIEWPACKKRRCEPQRESLCVNKEDGTERIKFSNRENVEEQKTIEGVNGKEKGTAHGIKDKLEKDTSSSTDQGGTSDTQTRNEVRQNSDKDRSLSEYFTPVILSESESNDSDKFECAKMERQKETERLDTPLMELGETIAETTEIESLSQLPVVDLGEDFFWQETSNKSAAESNNESNNLTANVSKVTLSESHSGAPQNTLTEIWSKGQVPGLQGPTDVKICGTSTNAVKAAESSSDGNLNNLGYDNSNCKGFSKFSREVRPQMIKENPKLTLPEIAQLIVTRWKTLSPEERGYYRDVANEEKKCSDMEKSRTRKEITEKKESEKNKKRLLKMLDKMKDMKPGVKKENLLKRTTVPMDIDVQTVSRRFSNGLQYKNSSPIIGPLNPDLWMVRVSSQIWMLSVKELRRKMKCADDELNDSDEVSADVLEKLLKQWLLEKDDMSIMVPIYDLK